MSKNARKAMAFLVRSTASRITTSQSAVVRIRGSWYFGDFHYDSESGKSFSDLDLLLVSGDLEDLQKVLSLALGELVAGVSIHSADYLGRMSLADSRILNVCEFCAKLGADESRMSYYRAKILLLLLRDKVTERYKSVARRTATVEAERALMAKVGSCSDFSIDDSLRLASTSTTAIVAEFADRFIRTRVPSEGAIDDMVTRLAQAETIAPWLVAHMRKKIAESLNRRGL